MQKLITLLACLIISTACHKETAVTPPAETSNQRLVKVTKTTYFTSFSYEDNMEYEYNEAGKITREGDTRYYRDANQRITRFTDPPNNTNRTQTDIYYADETSGKVAYTISDYLINGQPAHDSNSYIHDAKGMVIKVMNYGIDTNGAHLYYYNDLSYDDTGNLVHVRGYSINGNKVTVCGWNDYYGYDTEANPFYSNDEVRTLTRIWNGGNTSPNNYTSEGDMYTKYYVYRKDGRPSACRVMEGGRDAFVLTYYYQ